MIMYQRGELYVNLELRWLCVAQVAATPGIMSSSNSHGLRICASIKKNENYDPGQEKLF